MKVNHQKIAEECEITVAWIADREKTGSRTFVEEKLSSVENGLNRLASKKRVRIPWAHIGAGE